ncbi:hypothetical protein HYR99_39505 [Candidatus Poribacteria bacterium]|nr:hypothetical protein [Candidatus Poribacteria bacterium]
MSHSIAPHEPKELLVDSVDEVFAEAEASQKRWQEWEREHQLKSVRIQLSEAKYQVLEDLAKEQTKTTPQLIQALLDSILSTLMPSLQTHTK